MIFRRFNPGNTELQKETQTNGHNEELECGLLIASRCITSWQFTSDSFNQFLSTEANQALEGVCQLAVTSEPIATNAMVQAIMPILCAATSAKGASTWCASYLPSKSLPKCPAIVGTV